MSTDYNSAEYLRKLGEVWGFSQFKSSQEEVIKAWHTEGEVVALMPTGGGKSLCYQLPSLMTEGMTIVISPLIALMEDQVNRLKKLGVKAEAVHSALHFRDLDRILSNCQQGEIKLLYVSPERLQNERFCERMRYIDISFIAVDEAHCISQWGHQFRPSYLKIRTFMDLFPKARKMALTGSATDQVLSELKSELGMINCPVVHSSYERENLFIQVHLCENTLNRALDNIKSTPLPTLVYIRSRRKVEMFAQMLRNAGVNAAHYHAGLPYKVKQKISEDLVNHRIDAVVATNAFGMGIDIDNIRSVVHIGTPPSLEEYYQEIGRAGRDGLPASVMAFVGPADTRSLKEHIDLGFPGFHKTLSFIKSFYVHYNIHVGEGMGESRKLDFVKLSKKVQLSYMALKGHVDMMESLGLIEVVEKSTQSAHLTVTTSPRELRAHAFHDERYEVLDHLVRKYPLIFETFIQFDFDALVKRFYKSNEELTRFLDKMKLEGVLDWRLAEPGKRVVFLTNRERTQELKRHRKKYDFLRSIKIHLTRSMVDYLLLEECRSAYILNYFDQTYAKSCGHCDNCLKDNGISGSKRSISKEDLSVGELLKHDNRTLLEIQQLYNEL